MRPKYTNSDRNTPTEMGKYLMQIFVFKNCIALIFSDIFLAAGMFFGKFTLFGIFDMNNRLQSL